MKCDRCSMLSINGVACHELGCPNFRSRWNGTEWVKQHTCCICGHAYDVGSECCNDFPDINEKIET